MDLKEIQMRINEFAKLRNWDQFHSPKNLAMAIGSESGELLDIFQWMTEESSNKPDEKTMIMIQDELADIMIYCLRTCDVLGFDPIDCIDKKIKKNSKKYPVDESYGNSVKYNRR